ncbi:MAG TPA: RsmD family RNA methyltransferase [Planctomycetota bacterium]|nr:RsmD family RNA methyltransferase [Planctomycetota bacterium]
MTRSDLVRDGAVLTGGDRRGAKLFTVAGLDVRPALARMRNSLFQVLSSRLDVAALDLFAGIGTMGLEALSRGAEFVLFIDSDSRCVEAIRRNLEKLKFADRADVVEGDALQAPAIAASSGRTFGLVFIDPPYRLYDDPASRAKLEAAVAALPVKGLLAVEHRTVQKFGDTWAGGRLEDRRKYGGTTVSLYSR